MLSYFNSFFQEKILIEDLNSFSKGQQDDDIVKKKADKFSNTFGWCFFDDNELSTYDMFYERICLLFKCYSYEISHDIISYLQIVISKVPYLLGVIGIKSKKPLLNFFIARYVDSKSWVNTYQYKIKEGTIIQPSQESLDRIKKVKERNDLLYQIIQMIFDLHVKHQYIGCTNYSLISIFDSMHTLIQRNQSQMRSYSFLRMYNKSIIEWYIQYEIRIDEQTNTIKSYIHKITSKPLTSTYKQVLEDIKVTKNFKENQEEVKDDQHLLQYIIKNAGIDIDDMQDENSIEGITFDCELSTGQNELNNISEEEEITFYTEIDSDSSVQYDKRESDLSTVQQYHYTNILREECISPDSVDEKDPLLKKRE